MFILRIVIPILLVPFLIVHSLACSMQGGSMMKHHSAGRSSVKIYRDVPVYKNPLGKSHIYLHFEGIRRQRKSFSVRVFLNSVDVDVLTSTDSPAFAGTLFLYGQGPSPNPNDPTPLIFSEENHTGPQDGLVIITEAIERLGELPNHLDIALVIVDDKGDPLPSSAFEVDKIFIRAPENISK